MQKQSRRWLTIVVLSFISLGFLGGSMLPIIGGILNQKTPSPTSASPDKSADSAALLKEEEGYQIVLKRNPNDESVLTGLLKTRYQLMQAGVRQPKDMVEPLKQLVKLKPTDPRPASLLAYYQQQAGDLAGAAQTNRDILTQQPTNSTALQAYVQFLLKQQKSDEALDTVQQSIAVAKQMNQQQTGSADLPALELVLGDVYLSQNQDAKAISLYDRLQQENPNDFRPKLAKGLVFSHQGNTAEALVLMRAAEASAPVQVKPKIQAFIARTEAGPVPLSSPLPSGSPLVPSP